MVTSHGGDGSHPLSRLGSKNTFVGDFVARPSKMLRTRLSAVVSSAAGTDCQQTRTGIGTTGTRSETGRT